MNMFESGLYGSTLHNFLVAHECRAFFEVYFMIMVLDNFVNELQASTIETTNLSGWRHNTSLHQEQQWKMERPIKRANKDCKNKVNHKENTLPLVITYKSEINETTRTTY